MATKKLATKPLAAVPVGNDGPPNPDNPHSWLYLTGSDVPADQDRFMYGVLRSSYREWTNTALMFGGRKLRPVPAPDERVITAERAEVLLPVDADDRYMDPWTLLRSCDEERVDKLSSLLTYVTISEPRTQRLHEQWARGHAWVRQAIVDGLGVPVLMVQHAPHRQANGNPPHLHLLMGSRRLTSLGWTCAVADLRHDRGRDLLLKSWMSHVAKG